MRGVYEREPGSGIWWINYFADGQRRREKVGRKSDAIKLYQKRKSDAHAGIKLSVRGEVMLSKLVDDVLIRVQDYKDLRNYHYKAKMVRRELGSKPAALITPKDIDAWLTRFNTPATSNRYKAFLSLCYQEGIRNGLVSINVARLARHRREPKGRLRFLSHEEYHALHTTIATRAPQHLASFVVSVYTGMRRGEQFSVTWRQYNAKRRTLELQDTKNTEPRTVHLNATAVAAIESLRPNRTQSDVIFPVAAKQPRPNEWFDPCVKAAGIYDYTWHGNRHTFCSWLAMAGASLKEIQVAAGHKSIQMAARYAHLSPAHTASVVDRLVHVT